MRLIGLGITLAFLIALVGCNNGIEGSSGSAAGDAVQKDVPKSKSTEPDMPQPPGGMDRGGPVQVKK